MYKRQLLDESPRYVGMLENPALPKNERLALLDEAFGAGVHPFVLNFMKILCEKREMGVLHGAAADFRARWDEAHGRLGAVAQSAVPLTKAQQDKLAAKLSEMCIRDSRTDGVELSYEEDQGGVWLYGEDGYGNLSGTGKCIIYLQFNGGGEAAMHVEVLPKGAALPYANTAASPFSVPANGIFTAGSILNVPQDPSAYNISWGSCLLYTSRCV